MITSNLSFASCQLTLLRVYDSGEIAGKSHCSGFFWRHDKKAYLITNWHNVTGVNPDTGKHLGTFTPKKIELSEKLVREKINRILEYKDSIDLYSEDGNPIWYDHPNIDAVDIVAIDVFEENGLKVICVNDCGLVQDATISIAQDCHIVGFPEGFSGPSGTPIWKRASIATEPYLRVDEKPVFLVDTVGNRGLSGSPVLIGGQGGYQSSTAAFNVVPGRWSAFLGVYAGRMADKGILSQLGRVWKGLLLEEICRAAKRSQYSVQ